MYVTTFFLLIHRFHNFFFTFSAILLLQLICHKFFELIIINHMWFIVKILYTWQLFFLLIHRFQNFCFTFSVMLLPQLICHKFCELIIINHVWFIVKILRTWQLFFLFIHRFHNFFFHFRQWHCHNCQNKIFFPFSAMALPQLLFFF